MPENQQNQPRKDDAVLGGQSPPPIDSLVLGGIEGVKQRLSNPVIDVRIAALQDALNYGDAGIGLVIQALQDESRRVRRVAYQLLSPRKEPQLISALQLYHPWDLEERFQEYLGYKGMHAQIFANRPVVDFNPEVGITDPVGNAYAIRYRYGDNENALDRLARLLDDTQVGKLEALVFGMWDESGGDSKELVEALVSGKHLLSNLKALFIGDIAYDENEISWIEQSDLSPILRAYPQLEILQLRGGNNLEFSPPVGQENLQALIVETGGLGRETVAQICNMNLPGLEHLELWFGSEDYGGTCWTDSLTPILDDLVFPNLVYLGLRNSIFSNEIAAAVVNSPLLETIDILDLSMGTLSDKGAEILLQCPAINQLDILNVSQNYLSEEMVQRLSELDIRVIAENQGEDDYDDEEDEEYCDRYCSVAE
ncbi:MAG: STM4015 family protein [Nostocaceae cyanobacterium]|nr:STM4015 family protein [Nostocaceae cyanobacterium]